MPRKDARALALETEKNERKAHKRERIKQAKTGEERE